MGSLFIFERVLGFCEHAVKVMIINKLTAIMLLIMGFMATRYEREK
jgi:hypothetical protein